MDDFAVFLARVSDHFNFDYLSPVNEPQWDWKASGRGATQEGSPAQNREISQLVKLLSKELSLSGSEVQVVVGEAGEWDYRSEEHTSELQSLMRISYAVFCLKKKNHLDIAQ